MEGRIPRKRISRRQVINRAEWAEYLGKHPATAYTYLQEYQKTNKYNARDIFSVLDFLLWLLKKGKTTYENQEIRSIERNNEE